MPAKYIWGALIGYVIMAGIVMAIHPSSADHEILFDSLLWPLSFFGYIWDQVADFYGGLLA